MTDDGGLHTVSKYAFSRATGSDVEMAVCNSHKDLTTVFSRQRKVALFTVALLGRSEELSSVCIWRRNMACILAPS